jgi:hypothetical protein
VVVDKGKIENIVAQFKRTWQRSPTEKELDGLIEQAVKDEIYYREAVAQGMDQDDIVIRRHLRQKLEIVADAAADRLPTDEELQQFLNNHADLFRREALYSFDQIYFDPTKHKEHIERDATAALRELRSNGGIYVQSSTGDVLLLGSSFEDMPLADIRKKFGTDFADRMSQLEVGNWNGPVSSAFGLHLVRLRRRVDGEMPTLADVRAAVQREWALEQRNLARDVYYAKIRKNYTVRIDRPSMVTR